MVAFATFLHFSKPVWVYISIPIAAALVGWFTKIVAIEMMFRPIEFKGIRPFLGWQGQIPNGPRRWRRSPSTRSRRAR